MPARGCTWCHDSSWTPVPGRGHPPPPQVWAVTQAHRCPAWPCCFGFCWSPLGNARFSRRPAGGIMSLCLAVSGTPWVAPSLPRWTGGQGPGRGHPSFPLPSLGFRHQGVRLWMIPCPLRLLRGHFLSFVSSPACLPASGPDSRSSPCLGQAQPSRFSRGGVWNQALACGFLFGSVSASSELALSRVSTAPREGRRAGSGGLSPVSGGTGSLRRAGLPDSSLRVGAATGLPGRAREEAGAQGQGKPPFTPVCPRPSVPKPHTQLPWNPSCLHPGGLHRSGCGVSGRKLRALTLKPLSCVHVTFSHPRRTLRHLVPQPYMARVYYIHCPVPSMWLGRGEGKGMEEGPVEGCGDGWVGGRMDEL